MSSAAVLSAAAPAPNASARSARRRLRVAPEFEPTFARSSSAYEVLGAEILERVALWSEWPDVAVYDAWGAPLAAAARRPLVFRDVPRAAVQRHGGYDPFIHGTGCIPTRSRSWHDFFNACIWGRFPRAKLALHAAQLSEASRRSGPGRTRRQDALTHFDECGVLVECDQPELLERIAALDWQRLFVDERGLFARHVRLFCFGHAILEALREPHLGLMGKALFWRVHAFGSAPPEVALARADAWLAARLDEPDAPRLHALPVLGLPGWHAANRDPAFYAHPTYFRAQPRAPGAGEFRAPQAPSPT